MIYCLNMQSATDLKTWVPSWPNGCQSIKLFPLHNPYINAWIKSAQRWSDGLGGCFKLSHTEFLIDSRIQYRVWNNNFEFTHIDMWIFHFYSQYKLQYCMHACMMHEEGDKKIGIVSNIYIYIKGKYICKEKYFFKY